MRIVVEYFGQLRELTGCTRATVDVPPASRIADVLLLLAQTHGERFCNHVFTNGQPANHLLYAVGERQATATTILNEGDELLLLPPVSGGC